MLLGLQLLLGIGNKIKTINHVTLGKMEYRRLKGPAITIESCNFNYFFKPSNNEIALSFSAGEDGPSSLQIDRLKDIENRCEDILTSIEHYCNNSNSQFNISIKKYQISSIKVKMN